MRVRRSCGEKISSRFCFSSTETTRCEAIVSASLPGPRLDRGEHGVVVEVVGELDVLLEQPERPWTSCRLRGLEHPDSSGGG